MHRLALVGVLAVLCTGFAIGFAYTFDYSDTVYDNRTTVTTEIPPIPTHLPNPAKMGNRAQYLYEDFEGSTFPPLNWDTLNFNPGYGWFLGSYSGGGTQAAMVTWDQTPPATLQDEWLITPTLDFSAATSELRLEFYMLQGYTYPHDFKVYITDDDGANWTEIFDSYGTGYPQHQYYFVSVPLTSWIGHADPIRIGFQYYGTDADLFGLDNIEVTDNPRPTGRCCVYTDPLNPDCSDNVTQVDCNNLGGTWVEGLDCTSPCPLQGTIIEPSDDMYTDPDVGSGHPHPIDPYALVTADYTCAAPHHERAMLKWDLTSFAGETIDSAFLHIYRYFRCPGFYYTNCDFFLITEDWDEKTWDEYTHIRHGEISFLNFNYGPELGWYRHNVTQTVTQWIEGSVDNYGMVIRARSGERWSKFYSKEGTYPPYLEIYFATGENQCPILEAIEEPVIAAEADFELTVIAADPDLTTPELHCENMPTASSFTDNGDGTGTFGWNPTPAQAGDHTVLFYATDGQMADSQFVAMNVYICGSANGDGDINLLDILYLIDHIYGDPNGPEPIPPQAGDVNNDGNLNLLDILYLIAFIYDDPPGPSPECL